MRLGTEYIKNMAEKALEDNFRFIFLVGSDTLEDEIRMAGFNAIGINGKEDEAAFLEEVKQNQFSCLKDYYYIPSRSYGAINRIKIQLEQMQFKIIPNGWKIFKDKEERFSVSENREELKAALTEFAKKILSQPEETKSENLEMISMDEIEEEPVEWLVTDYLPKGQITIFAGDGGSCKTSDACEIMASISSGRPCFLEKELIPEEFQNREPQQVLFFSAEDSLKHVIKGRLRKNGAKMGNIKSINISDERFGDIHFDSPFLEKLLDKYRPALVVFDPIQSFLPPQLRMSERNAMRNCLRHLVVYGEKYGCTFLIIVHTNKQSGVWGRKRIADSADIWDIARSVLIAGETKEKGTWYVSHEKCNYGRTGKTVLVSNNDGKIEFQGYTDKKDRDFVTEVDFQVRNAPQREEAKEFILDFLKDGDEEVSELESAANAAGYKDKTLARAKTELRKEGKIRIYPIGNGKGNTKRIYMVQAI